jgi:hypothetical protein
VKFPAKHFFLAHTKGVFGDGYKARQDKDTDLGDRVGLGGTLRIGMDGYEYGYLYTIKTSS